MKYAVNIVDMSKEPFISAIMFGEYVGDREIVEAEKGRIDGHAVVVKCPPDVWENIKMIIRKRYHKNQFRLYERKKSAWQRV